MKIKTLFLLLLLPVISLAQEEVKEEAEKKTTWKTKLGLSYVNTKGNTETESYSSKLDISGEAHGNRYLVKSQYVVSSTAGVESANKLNTVLRAERVFTGRLFGFLGVTHLMDKFSGYDHRMSVGPGLGIDILKQEKQTLKGMLSSMYFYDDFAPAELDNETYPTAKTEVNYTRQIRENVSFSGNGDYLLSLVETEKYFATAELSLQVGISTHLAVGLGYQVNYQNKPPTVTIKKTDTTFLTSLVINW